MFFSVQPYYTLVLRADSTVTDARTFQRCDSSGGGAAPRSTFRSELAHHLQKSLQASSVTGWWCPPPPLHWSCSRLVPTNWRAVRMSPHGPSCASSDSALVWNSDRRLNRWTFSLLCESSCVSSGWTSGQTFLHIHSTWRVSPHRRHLDHRTHCCQVPNNLLSAEWRIVKLGSWMVLALHQSPPLQSVKTEALPCDHLHSWQGHQWRWMWWCPHPPGHGAALFSGCSRVAGAVEAEGRCTGEYQEGLKHISRHTFCRWSGLSASGSSCGSLKCRFVRNVYYRASSRVVFLPCEWSGGCPDRFSGWIFCCRKSSWRVSLPCESSCVSSGGSFG